MSKDKAQADDSSIPFLNLAEFFETVAPGTRVTVSGIPIAATYNPIGPPPPTSERLPQLNLYCEECNGLRYFLTDSRLFWEWNQPCRREFLYYLCNNCGHCMKTYAVEMTSSEVEGVGEVFKYGEAPSFGAHLPSKLISLIGPERELFLKGRRAENQGLGVGAFAYYRRVIESQKIRIIEEIIKAAQRLSATKDALDELNRAKSETRFYDALQMVKHALPSGIMIQGQNPLTLLHDALSGGLHGETDEACLASATSIRVVMAALAKQLSAVMEDDAELNAAVAHLLKKKAAKP